MMQANNCDMHAVRTHLSRAVDVNPEMAAKLIHILRRFRPTVRVVVAPYEADAQVYNDQYFHSNHILISVLFQLAYLSLNGFVDAIISEDSDCLPYGCKEVLFKLNGTTGGRGGNNSNLYGMCQRIRLADAFKPSGSEMELPSGSLDLRTFSQSMLVTMCVAAGCDYLASAKGFAIKTSYKYVAKYR